MAEVPPTYCELPEEIIDMIAHQVTNQSALVGMIQALPRMAAACYPDERGARSLLASRLMDAPHAAQLLGGYTFEQIEPHLDQVVCGYPAIALAALEQDNRQLFDTLVAKGLVSSDLLDLVNMSQPGGMGFDTSPTFPSS